MLLFKNVPPNTIKGVKIGPAKPNAAFAEDAKELIITPLRLKYNNLN